MERFSTKQEILNAALELFSTQGFDATSVSQIADAVGIRKASLYSHFKGKQEILDELTKRVLESYEKHSIFAAADWEDPDFTKNMQALNFDSAVQLFLGQVRYILQDPQLSRARKLLTIEQFRNPQLAELQTKQNYTDIMRYFTGLIGFLIRQKKLVADEPELLAAELCLPVNVWINLCDREPEHTEATLALAERHIRHFFKTNAGFNAP